MKAKINGKQVETTPEAYSAVCDMLRDLSKTLSKLGHDSVRPEHTEAFYHADSLVMAKLFELIEVKHTPSPWLAGVVSSPELVA